MCVVSLDQCNCSCHNMVGIEISHIVPCCQSCRYCFKGQIKDWAIRQHEDECYANPKNRQTVEPSQVVDPKKIEF